MSLTAYKLSDAYFFFLLFFILDKALFSLRVGCHLFITFRFHDPDTYMLGIHSWGENFQFVSVISWWIS